MPQLPKSQEDAMLRQFRENTDEYFRYFSEKNQKTPADVTLIFSREDIFTSSHLRAAELVLRAADQRDEYVPHGRIAAILMLSSLDAGYGPERYVTPLRKHLVRPSKVLLAFVYPHKQIVERQ